jgi:hypothetical protein
MGNQSSFLCCQTTPDKYEVTPGYQQEVRADEAHWPWRNSAVFPCF